MSPNLLGSSLYLSEENALMKKAIDDSRSTTQTSEDGKNRDYEWQIVWRNVIAFVYLHIGTLYGFYLILTGQCKLYTLLFSLLFMILAAMGVTAGAHRLWAHRCYKARWPLRLILVIFQTMAFQNHVYEWVRDHRVHHKFTETDADPHNARRGFFFSHIGWLMVRKHKDVFEKGATVDMSDLEADPIIMFQKRTYLVMMPLVSFFFPTLIPVYFWGEAPWTSWYVAAVWRFTVSLNATWLVNSAAHMYGTKPYDQTLQAVENVGVAILAMGEGWHNYHHVFPWDYKAAELGKYSTNISTGFIDLAAKIGWAYDLKTVSAEMIKKRVLRTGDGSHPISQDHAAAKAKELEDENHHHHHHHPANPIWGWGDVDMTEEDRQLVDITNRKED